MKGVTMKVMCYHCETAHTLNAAQMTVVIERQQKGYGHRFGKVPARPYPKVATNVVPICFLKLVPTREAVKSKR